jgi:hypothetical protein
MKRVAAKMVVHEMRKAALLARMQRALRPPRLTERQLQALSLVHVVNLDAIASGQADVHMMWDFVGGALTGWRAAQLANLGVDELRPQRDLALRLVDRYRRTGLVRFEGPDYQLARDGMAVMDALASAIPQATAAAAADWSEVETQRLADALPEPLQVAA